MNPIPEIRFAIIGCGLMGSRHARVLRATAGARVTCLQDRDREQASRIAAPGERVAATHAEVLQSPDVDAVVICLPSALHAQYGVEAARAGKHVVVEKPIDSDPAMARLFAGECASRNLVCAEIKQNRFSDGLAAAKRAVEQGLLGKVVLARASVKWFRHDPYYTESDWRGRLSGEGGGVLINQAIHSTDALLWLFGRPDEISAFTASNRGTVLETEDTAVAIFRFPGGIVASLEASTSAYPGFDERYEFHGTEGSCVVEKGRIVFWKQAGELPAPPPPAWLPIEGDLDPKLALFQRQYRNILAAMRGEEALAVSPEEAIAAVEVTRACYRSAGAPISS